MRISKYFMKDDSAMVIKHLIVSPLKLCIKRLQGKNYCSLFLAIFSVKTIKFYKNTNCYKSISITTNKNKIAKPSKLFNMITSINQSLQYKDTRNRYDNT